MSTLRKALLIELIRKSSMGWIVVYAYCNRIGLAVAGRFAREAGNFGRQRIPITMGP
jgi:hypothetical protein